MQRQTPILRPMHFPPPDRAPGNRHSGYVWSQDAREKYAAELEQERNLEDSLYRAAVNMADSFWNVPYKPFENKSDQLIVKRDSEPEERVKVVKIEPIDSNTLKADIKISFFTSEGTVVEGRKSGDEDGEWNRLPQGLKSVPAPYLNALLFAGDEVLRYKKNSKEAAKRNGGFLRRITDKFK